MNVPLTKFLRNINMDIIVPNKENNIDINEYVEYDADDNTKFTSRKEQFLEDALEYLKNEYQNYKIVEAEARARRVTNLVLVRL